jgi:hypothetical protein
MCISVFSIIITPPCGPLEVPHLELVVQIMAEVTVADMVEGKEVDIKLCDSHRSFQSFY